MTPEDQVVISVLLPDRVGILRAVTRVILDFQGNIGGIRQSIVDGFFSLTFTAALARPADPATIRQALEHQLGAEAAVAVRPVTQTPLPVLPDGQPFVALTRGPDKPGTIHAISAFFVQHGINIADWQVEVANDQVVYIAQVRLPVDADPRLIQQAFRDQMALHGLTATLAHENIFRATNEIGPISALLTPA
jgi:predicted amino acid-binding ACT domain protein